MHRWGSAFGAVVRIADRTMIGTVAVLASQTSNTVSTLQRETWRVVIFITISAIGAAILILVLVGGLLRGDQPHDHGRCSELSMWS